MSKNNIILYINKPRPDSCVVGNTLYVEVFAMDGKNHCDYEHISEQFGEKKEIFVKIDEKLVATARLLDNKKTIYTTKIDLKNITEGKHTIKAIFPKDFSFKTSTIIEPAHTAFYVKKSNTILKNKVHSNDTEQAYVYTTNESEITIDKLSSAFTETQKHLSELDLQKCTISINDESPKSLLSNKDYLFFPILTCLKNLPEKQNKITITLFNKSDNKKECRYEFIINKAETIEKFSNKFNKDQRKRDLPSKTKIDPLFIKQWLKNPSEIATKIGLNHFNEIKNFLPPLFSEEYINFSVKSDNESDSQILNMLMARVSNALKENIPSTLESLKRDGVYTETGKLTDSAKETIHLALENPIKMLESIGITLTDKERDTIFPPFQKKDVEKVTKWICTSQLNKVT